MTSQDTTQATIPSESAEIQSKTLVDKDIVKATPKFTEEELMTIFDEIIFSGEYEEVVTIKGKLKVTFRARSAEDTVAISKDIDAKNFTLISTLQEHRSLLNLAYSMIGYAGRDLKSVTIEDRKKTINKLPAVVVGAVSEALTRFDFKISEACKSAEENF